MMAHDLTIGEVGCDSIRVIGRHRKDMGDIDALAASIATEGLLQPIGITEDNLLVFGERRLLAVRDTLKRATIAARVVQVSSIVAGEYAENEIRKDFTPSERAAIGEAVAQQISGRQGQRTDRELPRNCAEVEPGVETRAIAARMAGFGSKDTYERAKKVVEHAVDEIVAQMDSGQLAVSSAALIADEQPERQREIAAMPECQQKEVVRKLRQMDLPTPGEAHERAKETGKAILDRNLQWQTPMPMEQRRPLIERNHAVMAVVEAARAMAMCPLTAAEVAAGIHEFDTPDVDFAGQCRKAAVFLQQINQELERPCKPPNARN